MAKDIELECPSCNTLLELDAGFAGGVCRCSDCGTLMTVPRRSGGKSEQLRRQSAPGGDESEAPVNSRGEETYQTASGREVKVNARKIPTAKKRKGVRAATAAVVGLILLGVIVGVCYAGYYVYTELNKPDPNDPEVIAVQEELFAYDPDANPYEIEQANAIGFPLRERTAVVIDASKTSADYMADLQKLLIAGLVGKESEKEINVFLANDTGRSSLGGMKEVGDIQAKDLTELFTEFPAQGKSDWAGTLTDAVEDEPQLVLIVTSGFPPTAEAQAAAEVIKGISDSVTIDMLMLGGDSVQLEQAVEDRGGRFERFVSNLLSKWANDAGK